MTPKLGSRIQSLLLIASVLTVSACATTSPKETLDSKTDETARVTIEKEKFETPPALSQPTTTQPVTEPVKSASNSAPDASHAPQAAPARITLKEPFVNVRSAPSVKSRAIAVLKAGQTFDILETRGSWLKISWQKGEVLKQGWMNKRFLKEYDKY